LALAGVDAGEEDRMASTKVVDTILSGQDLPLEFRHQSSAHQGEEGRVATRLSGVIAPRQQDEVICPYLLRRNLVVPAQFGPAAQGFHQAR
jgi:hypothetical protein